MLLTWLYQDAVGEGNTPGGTVACSGYGRKPSLLKLRVDLVMEMQNIVQERFEKHGNFRDST